MNIDTVYQVVEFEVCKVNSPEVQEVLQEWGYPDVLDEMPQDTLDAVREDGAFLIYNKSNQGVGLVDVASLTLNFEEANPVDGVSDVRMSVLDELKAKVNAKIDAGEESAEYLRGLLGVSDILNEIIGGRGEA